MHDDETRHTPAHTSNRMPWEMDGHDEPTRVHAHDTPEHAPEHAYARPYEGQDGYWNAPRTREPDVGATLAATRIDDGPGPARRWLIPALLLVCGLCAFAIVTFFLTGRHSSPPTGANTVARQVQSTPTASDAAPADFPAETTDECQDDVAHSLRPNPLAAEVRMKIDVGTSCGYLENVRTAVLDHLQQDHTRQQFEIAPESPANGDSVHPATCQPAGSHLTFCWTSGKARMWIKDSVN